VRTNYILVDQENVHLQGLPKVVCEDHFRLIVFVGENQTKLAFDLVATLQKLGDRAQYVKIAGNGSNALDFHIAYMIGRLAVEDAKACFHIISKDTGFDPLIRHLKSQKICVTRVAAIQSLAFLNPLKAHSDKDRIKAVVTNLQTRKASKPARVATLVSTMNSLFQKQLSETQLNALVQQLKSAGYIKIDGEKLTYSLPENV
jgi:hypothetical protein